MKTKTILLAAVSAIVAAGGAGVAIAQDDYGYYGRYDDQAEETRRLNLLQLQHPGAGEAAVPGARHQFSNVADDDDYGGPGDDDDGMGGPTYSGPPSPDDLGDADDAPPPDAAGPDDDDDDVDAAPPPDGPDMPGDEDDDDR